VYSFYSFDAFSSTLTSSRLGRRILLSSLLLIVCFVLGDGGYIKMAKLPGTLK
jgi:hypothetical protein